MVMLLNFNGGRSHKPKSANVGGYGELGDMGYGEMLGDNNIGAHRLIRIDFVQNETKLFDSLFQILVVKP